MMHCGAFGHASNKALNEAVAELEHFPKGSTKGMMIIHVILVFSCHLHVLS